MSGKTIEVDEGSGMKIANGSVSILAPYLAAALLLSLACSQLHAQQIAFTMDDLPSHGPLPPNVTRLEVAQAVLKALTDAGLPPTYGFVNGIHDEQEPGSVAVLDEWVKRGNLLGNHTWSHINLNTNTVAAFEADLEKNEALLSTKMRDRDWRWLRYPYLAEGDTPGKKQQVRSYLAQHHYRIAAVTMSFGDYLWNEPYARCMARGDQAAVASLEASYLGAAKTEAQFELAASRQLYGREIPFVLLMHIGAFDARMLPRLLAQYKDMGLSFVTLDAAEKDPFYESDLNPAAPAGPTNLQAAAWMKGIKLSATPPSTPDLANVCK